MKRTIDEVWLRNLTLVTVVTMNHKEPRNLEEAKKILQQCDQALKQPLSVGWSRMGQVAPAGLWQIQTQSSVEQKPKWCVISSLRDVYCVLSHVRLLVAPWILVHRALCSWDFPGKNTGVGCHLPSPGDLPLGYCWISSDPT